MVELGERRTILLLCYINLLIYINRGVIPGAPESFQTFITKSLGVSVERQNFYLGLLLSIYVASTMCFSLVFGYLSFSKKPFHLITGGMTLWVCAAIISAVAYYTTSYYLLMLGRVLSGAGEASFMCNAMPFINRNAPHESSTLWLGILVATMTGGTAGGYIYGSGFAESSLTWAAAFFVEAALMVPAILLIIFAVPARLNEIPTTETHNGLLTDGETPADKSFVRHLLRVYSNVAFTMLSFGFAAYTFTLGAFSTFSPTLLIGLGFFETENDVSLVFGAVVVVSGTIGTVLGAMILDRRTAATSFTPAKRCRLAVDMLVQGMAITLFFGVIMMFFTKNKTVYILVLAVTYFFMAALNPIQMVAVMELFPESRQAMAVAANTFVALAGGDVPAPSIIGWLKDSWAPHCGTVEINGKSDLNPLCHLDRTGLRNVLLFSVLWLIWGLLFWTGAKFVLRRKGDKLDDMESPAIVSGSESNRPSFIPMGITPRSTPRKQ